MNFVRGKSAALHPDRPRSRAHKSPLGAAAAPFDAASFYGRLVSEQSSSKDRAGLESSGRNGTRAREEMSPSPPAPVPSSSSSSSSKRKNTVADDARRDPPAPSPLFCATCSMFITEPGGMLEHRRSTLHLFKESLPASARPNKNAIWLPENNRGYQMLQHKLGWREDEGGLGADRQGRMAPVPTVLKLDTAGLGRKRRRPGSSSSSSSSSCAAATGTAARAAAATEAILRNSVGGGDGKARVTHFYPHHAGAGGANGDAVGGLSKAKRAQSEVNAAASAAAAAEVRRQRRIQAAEEEKARRLEEQRAAIDLRADVPDGYEELYLRGGGGGEGGGGGGGRGSKDDTDRRAARRWHNRRR